MKSLILKAVREGLGRLIVFISFITRPKQVKRSQEQQKNVNEQTSKLSLYQYYACPFCTKTRRTIHQLNLPIEYRDAKSQPHRQELAEQGGQLKVPCLRIEDGQQVQWLYESKDIIGYLNQRFA